MQKNKPKKKLQTYQKWLIGLGVFLLLVLAWDVLLVGNIIYLVKWRECGSQPVVVRHPWSFGFGYEPQKTEIITHPGFFDEKRPIIVVADPSLNCSLEGAKKMYKNTNITVE